MKIKYPIGIIDLRDQLEHITPKKIQIFREYGTNPSNARLFSKLITRGKKQIISNGTKLIESRVI